MAATLSSFFSFLFLQHSKEGDDNITTIAFFASLPFSFFVAMEQRRRRQQCYCHLFFLSCSIAKKATTMLLPLPFSFRCLLFFCYSEVKKVTTTTLPLPFFCCNVAKKVKITLLSSFFLVAVQRRKWRQATIALFFLCCCNIAKKATIAYRRLLLFVYLQGSEEGDGSKVVVAFFLFFCSATKKAMAGYRRIFLVMLLQRSKEGDDSLPSPFFCCVAAA